jgi:hypothetical protein
LSAAAVSCVLGTVVGSAASSAAAAPGTGVWGPPHALEEVHGIGTFAAPGVLSCSGIGDCAVGGQDFSSTYANWPGVTATERNGTWERAVLLPKLNVIGAGFPTQVAAISCGAPGDCVTGGWYAPGRGGDSFAQNPFIVTEHNYSWGNAGEPPTTAINADIDNSGQGAVTAVSCAARGYCVAGGFYTIVSPHTGPWVADGFLLEEKAGKWLSAWPLAGLPLTSGWVAEINALSCVSPGNCTAVGSLWDSADFPEPPGKAFVVTERSGTWHAPLMIAGMPAMTLLSCPAVGDCTAASGSDVCIDPGSVSSCSTSANYVVDEKNGTWGKPRKILGATQSVKTLSCGSPGNCVAGGSFGLLAEKSGRWGKPFLVPGLSTGATVNSVSCSAAGYCDAGGSVNKNGFLVTEARGAWGRARTLNYGQVGAVSCFAAFSCAALIGAKTISLQGWSIPVYAAVLDKEVPQATRSVLTVSARTISYGDEQAERVSTRVSAGLGTPGGTVVIGSGAASACVAGLADGIGGCVLVATALPAGRHVLTGFYLGQSLFKASTSASVAVTVLKDATATKLGVSAAKVRYGHEHAERVTTTVRARYGNSPGGKVVVRAGSTTICVITLTRGTGSCLLSATKLKPGAYQLVARFAGNVNFVASSSARQVLTITK